MSERRDEMTEREIADALARPRPADADWRPSVEAALAETRSMPQRRRRASWTGLFAGGLRLATAATAAVVMVMLAVTAVDLIGRVRDGEPTGALPSLVEVEGFVVARRAVPAEEPVAAVVADGSLWVGTLGAQLHRLDPLTGEPVAATTVPGNVCGPLTATPGSVWVVTCPSGLGSPDDPTSLVRVDTVTGDIVATVQLAGHAVRQPVVLGETLWVIEDEAAGVLRPVSLSTSAAGVAVTVGAEIGHVAAGFGGLWLSAPEAQALLRYDPVRGEVVDTISLDAVPGVVVSDGAGVWVAMPARSEIVRLDPDRGVVTARLPVSEGNPLQIAATASELWVLIADELIRIDTARPRVGGRFRVGAHSVNFPPQFVGPTYALAIGEGVWFVPPRGEMFRFEP